MARLPSGGSKVLVGGCIALLLFVGAWLALRAAQPPAAAPAPAAAAAKPDAEPRVGLVIGNSAYRMAARLDNPMHDAEGVAVALHKVGFKLIGGRAQLDLDKRGMERAIRDFGRSLESGAVGLFYYSGHGVEVGGHNYLIPVDADPKEAGDVPLELVDVDLLLGQVKNAGNPLSMIVLDACRNNPFGARGLRAMGAGLAEIRDRPSGTIISYATAPGKVAADGLPGEHSPYTAAFIEAVQRPDIDVVEAFTWVQSEVDTKTKGEQQPWLGISPIHGQFFFVSPRPTATITTPPGRISPETPEMMLWSSVKDSGDPAMLQTYLDQFPHGTFAGLAKVIIEKLKPKQTAALRPKSDVAEAPPAHAADTLVPIEEMQGAYITVKRTSIRDKPLADAKVVKALEPGVKLRITGLVKNSDWVRVASLDNEVRGFLPGDAIQDVRAAEEGEWQQVKDAKQSAVVVDFLRRYPAGTHAEQAKILRDALMKDEEAIQVRKAEEAAWQRVKNARQSSLVTEFLKRYPAGAYAAQAKILRDVLVKDEEAAQRQKAKEAALKAQREAADRMKTEEAVQRRRTEEAAQPPKAEEVLQRQKIVEGDQRKNDSPLESNSANAESSRPQQQAMIAPPGKAVTNPTAAPRPYDGNWKGQALLAAYGRGVCEIYFTITVTDNVLTGTAHIDNLYNKLNFNVSGEIRQDGSVKANVGSHENLVGRFTSNDFKGTLTGFTCNNPNLDTPVNLTQKASVHLTLVK
ncbi:MAG: caspase family protein [Alphaproteobacteria bacterium]